MTLISIDVCADGRFRLRSCANAGSGKVPMSVLSYCAFCFLFKLLRQLVNAVDAKISGKYKQFIQIRSFRPKLFSVFRQKIKYNKIKQKSYTVLISCFTQK